MKRIFKATQIIFADHMRKKRLRLLSVIITKKSFLCVRKTKSNKKLENWNITVAQHQIQHISIHLTSGEQKKCYFLHFYFHKFNSYEDFKQFFF